MRSGLVLTGFNGDKGTGLNFPLVAGGKFNPVPLCPEVAIENRSVGVHAAVTEERPVAADGLDERGIAARDQNLLALAAFGDVAAEGVGDEGVAEEGDAVGAGLVLVTDPVRRGDVDAVGDRVRPLADAPGLDLR